MFKRVTASILALSFGFAVLFISAFRTAAVKFEFTGPIQNLSNTTRVLGEADNQVEYVFPYPGNILPDSPIWPIKAVRDKMWLSINTNAGKEADLLLLFADKRLLAGQQLFSEGDHEEGFITMAKAEKYLERAMNKEIENREAGLETEEFLLRINRASLAHYGVIEDLKPESPSDALPRLVEIQDYPVMVYRTSRDALLEKGLPPVENPYSWN